MYPDETTTPADPDEFAPDADDGWWINRRAAIQPKRDALRRNRTRDGACHLTDRFDRRPSYSPNGRRIGFR